MKSLFSVVLGIGAFAAVQAQAKELTFYFDINSSGPEIYPCNAGIRHPVQTPFCHFKGISTECSPSNIGGLPPANVSQANGWNTADEQKAHACICTGSAGSAIMDYVKYEARKAVTPSGTGTPGDHYGWGDLQTGTLTGSTQHGSGIQHTVTTKLWGSESIENELKTQVEKVTFNLGSELYGAEYFVDLCYRGSQIEYWEDGAAASFATSSWVQVSDSFNGAKSYLDMAEPGMDFTMVCDKQGMGTHKTARGADNTYDNFDTDLAETSVTDWIGTLSGDKKWENSIAKLVQTRTDLLNGWVNGNGTWASLPPSGTDDRAYSPRFCKARYYFKEKKDLKRERAWQRHDARVFLKWKIEEALEETQPQ